MIKSYAHVPFIRKEGGTRTCGEQDEAEIFSIAKHIKRLLQQNDMTFKLDLI